MNCKEFQQRLTQAIEAHGPTATESAAFDEHVRQCEAHECSRVWDEHTLLLRATAAWRSAVPEVDLRERVIRELREPSAPVRLNATYRMVQDPSAKPRSPANSRRSWKAGAVATVAAALLLVSLVTLNQPATTKLASNAADSPPPMAIADSDLDDATQSGASPETRGHLYATMPLSATEFMTDAVVFVVPADLGDPADEPSRADVWATRIEKQLEPIGKELSSAFESLMQAVPKSPTSST